MKKIFFNLNVKYNAKNSSLLNTSQTVTIKPDDAPNSSELKVKSKSTKNSGAGKDKSEKATDHQSKEREPPKFSSVKGETGHESGLSDSPFNNDTSGPNINVCSVTSSSKSKTDKRKDSFIGKNSRTKVSDDSEEEQDPNDRRITRRISYERRAKQTTSNGRESINTSKSRIGSKKTPLESNINFPVYSTISSEDLGDSKNNPDLSSSLSDSHRDVSELKPSMIYEKSYSDASINSHEDDKSLETVIPATKQKGEVFCKSSSSTSTNEEDESQASECTSTNSKQYSDTNTDYKTGGSEPDEENTSPVTTKENKEEKVSDTEYKLLTKTETRQRETNADNESTRLIGERSNLKGKSSLEQAVAGLNDVRDQKEEVKNNKLDYMESNKEETNQETLESQDTVKNLSNTSIQQQNASKSPSDRRKEVIVSRNLLENLSDMGDTSNDESPSSKQAVASNIDHKEEINSKKASSSSANKSQAAKDKSKHNDSDTDNKAITTLSGTSQEIMSISTSGGLHPEPSVPEKLTVKQRIAKYNNNFGVVEPATPFLKKTVDDKMIRHKETTKSTDLGCSKRDSIEERQFVTEGKDNSDGRKEEESLKTLIHASVTEVNESLTNKESISSMMQDVLDRNSANEELTSGGLRHESIMHKHKSSFERDLNATSSEYRPWKLDENKNEPSKEESHESLGVAFERSELRSSEEVKSNRKTEAAIENNQPKSVEETDLRGNINSLCRLRQNVAEIQQSVTKIFETDVYIPEIDDFPSRLPERISQNLVMVSNNKKSTKVASKSASSGQFVETSNIPENVTVAATSSATIFPLEPIATSPIIKPVVVESKPDGQSEFAVSIEKQPSSVSARSRSSIEITNSNIQQEQKTAGLNKIEDSFDTKAELEDENKFKQIFVNMKGTETVPPTESNLNVQNTGAIKNDIVSKSHSVWSQSESESNSRAEAVKNLETPVITKPTSSKQPVSLEMSDFNSGNESKLPNSNVISKSPSTMNQFDETSSRSENATVKSLSTATISSLQTSDSNSEKQPSTAFSNNAQDVHSKNAFDLSPVNDESIQNLESVVSKSASAIGITPNTTTSLSSSTISLPQTSDSNSENESMKSQESKSSVRVPKKTIKQKPPPVEINKDFDELTNAFKKVLSPAAYAIASDKVKKLDEAVNLSRSKTENELKEDNDKPSWKSIGLMKKSNSQTNVQQEDKTLDLNTIKDAPEFGDKNKFNKDFSGEPLASDTSKATVPLDESNQNVLDKSVINNDIVLRQSIETTTILENIPVENLVSTTSLSSSTISLPQTSDSNSENESMKSQESKSSVRVPKKMIKQNPLPVKINKDFDELRNAFKKVLSPAAYALASDNVKIPEAVSSSPVTKVPVKQSDWKTAGLKNSRSSIEIRNSNVDKYLQGKQLVSEDAEPVMVPRSKTENDMNKDNNNDKPNWKTFGLMKKSSSQINIQQKGNALNTIEETAEFVDYNKSQNVLSEEKLTSGYIKETETVPQVVIPSEITPVTTGSIQNVLVKNEKQRDTQNAFALNTSVDMNVKRNIETTVISTSSSSDTFVSLKSEGDSKNESMIKEEIDRPSPDGQSLNSEATEILFSPNSPDSVKIISHENSSDCKESEAREELVPSLTVKEIENASESAAKIESSEQVISSNRSSIASSEFHSAASDDLLLGPSSGPLDDSLGDLNNSTFNLNSLNASASLKTENKELEMDQTIHTAPEMAPKDRPVNMSSKLPGAQATAVEVPTVFSKYVLDSNDAMTHKEGFQDFEPELGGLKNQTNLTKNIRAPSLTSDDDLAGRSSSPLDEPFGDFNNNTLESSNLDSLNTSAVFKSENDDFSSKIMFTSSLYELEKIQKLTDVSDNDQNESEMQPEIAPKDEPVHKSSNIPNAQMPLVLQASSFDGESTAFIKYAQDVHSKSAFDLSGKASLVTDESTQNLLVSSKSASTLGVAPNTIMPLSSTTISLSQTFDSNSENEKSQESLGNRTLPKKTIKQKPPPVEINKDFDELRNAFKKVLSPAAYALASDKVKKLDAVGSSPAIASGIEKQSSLVSVEQSDSKTAEFKKSRSTIEIRNSNVDKYLQGKQLVSQDAEPVIVSRSKTENDMRKKNNDKLLTTLVVQASSSEEESTVFTKNAQKLQEKEFQDLEAELVDINFKETFSVENLRVPSPGFTNSSRSSSEQQVSSDLSDDSRGSTGFLHIPKSDSDLFYLQEQKKNQKLEKTDSLKNLLAIAIEEVQDDEKLENDTEEFSMTIHRKELSPLYPEVMEALFKNDLVFYALRVQLEDFLSKKIIYIHVERGADVVMISGLVRKVDLPTMEAKLSKLFHATIAEKFRIKLLLEFKSHDLYNTQEFKDLLLAKARDFIPYVDFFIRDNSIFACGHNMDIKRALNDRSDKKTSNILFHMEVDRIEKWHAFLYFARELVDAMKAKKIFKVLQNETVDGITSYSVKVRHTAAVFTIFYCLFEIISQKMQVRRIDDENVAKWCKALSKDGLLKQPELENIFILDNLMVSIDQDADKAYRFLTWLFTNNKTYDIHFVHLQMALQCKAFKCELFKIVHSFPYVFGTKNMGEIILVFTRIDHNKTDKEISDELNSRVKSGLLDNYEFFPIKLNFQVHLPADVKDIVNKLLVNLNKVLLTNGIDDIIAAKSVENDAIDIVLCGPRTSIQNKLTQPFQAEFIRCDVPDYIFTLLPEFADLCAGFSSAKNQLNLNENKLIGCYTDLAYFITAYDILASGLNFRSYANFSIGLANTKMKMVKNTVLSNTKLLLEIYEKYSCFLSIIANQLIFHTPKYEFLSLVFLLLNESLAPYKLLVLPDENYFPFPRMNWIKNNEMPSKVFDVEVMEFPFRSFYFNLYNPLLYTYLFDDLQFENYQMNDQAFCDELIRKNNLKMDAYSSPYQTFFVGSKDEQNAIRLAISECHQTIPKRETCSIDYPWDKFNFLHIENLQQKFFNFLIEKLHLDVQQEPKAVTIHTYKEDFSKTKAILDQYFTSKPIFMHDSLLYQDELLILKYFGYLEKIVLRALPDSVVMIEPIVEDDDEHCVRYYKSFGDQRSLELLENCNNQANYLRFLEETFHLKKFNYELDREALNDFNMELCYDFPLVNDFNSKSVFFEFNDNQIFVFAPNKDVAIDAVLRVTNVLKQRCNTNVNIFEVDDVGSESETEKMSNSQPQSLKQQTPLGSLANQPEYVQQENEQHAQPQHVDIIESQILEKINLEIEIKHDETQSRNVAQENSLKSESEIENKVSSQSQSLGQQIPLEDLDNQQPNVDQENRQHVQQNIDSDQPQILENTNEEIQTKNDENEPSNVAQENGSKPESQTENSEHQSLKPEISFEDIDNQHVQRQNVDIVQEQSRITQEDIQQQNFAINQPQILKIETKPDENPPQTSEQKSLENAPMLEKSFDFSTSEDLTGSENEKKTKAEEYSIKLANTKIKMIKDSILGNKTLLAEIKQKYNCNLTMSKNTIKLQTLRKHVNAAFELIAKSLDPYKLLILSSEDELFPEIIDYAKTNSEALFEKCNVLLEQDALQCYFTSYNPKYFKHIFDSRIRQSCGINDESFLKDFIQKIGLTDESFLSDINVFSNALESHLYGHEDDLDRLVEAIQNYEGNIPSIPTTSITYPADKFPFGKFTETFLKFLTANFKVGITQAQPDGEYEFTVYTDQLEKIKAFLDQNFDQLKIELIDSLTYQEESKIMEFFDYLIKFVIIKLPESLNLMISPEVDDAEEDYAKGTYWCFGTQASVELFKNWNSLEVYTRFLGERCKVNKHMFQMNENQLLGFHQKLCGDFKLVDEFNSETVYFEFAKDRIGVFASLKSKAKNYFNKVLEIFEQENKEHIQQQNVGIVQPQSHGVPQEFIHPPTFEKRNEEIVTKQGENQPQTTVVEKIIDTSEALTDSDKEKKYETEGYLIRLANTKIKMIKDSILGNKTLLAEMKEKYNCNLTMSKNTIKLQTTKEHVNATLQFIAKRLDPYKLLILPSEEELHPEIVDYIRTNNDALLRKYKVELEQDALQCYFTSYNHEFLTHIFVTRRRQPCSINNEALLKTFIKENNLDINVFSNALESHLYGFGENLERFQNLKCDIPSIPTTCITYPADKFPFGKFTDTFLKFLTLNFKVGVTQAQPAGEFQFTVYTDQLEKIKAFLDQNFDQLKIELLDSLIYQEESKIMEFFDYLIKFVVRESPESLKLMVSPEIDDAEEDYAKGTYWCFGTQASVALFKSSNNSEMYAKFLLEKYRVKKFTFKMDENQLLRFHRKLCGDFKLVDEFNSETVYFEFAKDIIGVFAMLKNKANNNFSKVNDYVNV